MANHHWTAKQVDHCYERPVSISGAIGYTTRDCTRGCPRENRRVETHNVHTSHIRQRAKRTRSASAFWRDPSTLQERRVTPRCIQWGECAQTLQRCYNELYCVVVCNVVCCCCRAIFFVLLSTHCSGCYRLIAKGRVDRWLFFCGRWRNLLFDYR